MTAAFESERLRKALQWAGEELKAPKPEPARVVFEKACMKFDLTPRECETLGKLMFAKPEEV